MATIRINGMTVEYQQAGSGPDLLLLHSLLTEMRCSSACCLAALGAHRVTWSICRGSRAVGSRSKLEFGSRPRRSRLTRDGCAGASADCRRFRQWIRRLRRARLAIRHGGRMGRLIVADTAGRHFRSRPGAISRHGGRSAHRRHQRSSRNRDRTHVFPCVPGGHPDAVAARKAALAAVRSRHASRRPALHLRARSAAPTGCDTQSDAGHVRRARSDDAAGAGSRAGETPFLARLTGHRGLGPLPDARAIGRTGGDDRVVHDRICVLRAVTDRPSVAGSRRHSYSDTEGRD